MNLIPLQECDPLADPRNTRVSGSGGFPSNTPPANSHTNQREFIGTDTLVLAYGVRFNETQFNVLAERLDNLKREAAEGLTPTLRLAGSEGTVRPTGAKLGGGRGPLMAWQIEVGSLVIQIMRRHEPSGETPNVRVQVGALACLGLGGVKEADELARKVIESLGGEVTFDKVSRWDPFVDLADVEVSEFVDAVREERIVTRSRNRSEFGVYSQGNKPTGISLGAGICFRAYDKIHELKRDSVKRKMWEDCEWKGNPPKVCTRAEFELKREQLKTLGIDSIADLIEKGGSVLRYLTEKWLRVADSTFDKTHTTRVVLAAVWRRIQLAFTKWAPSYTPAVRSTLRGSFEVDHLVQMIRGCAESIAVIQGDQVHGFDDLMGLLSDKMYANRACLGPSKYKAKLTLFEARIPDALGVQRTDRLPDHRSRPLPTGHASLLAG